MLGLCVIIVGTGREWHGQADGRKHQTSALPRQYNY